MAPNTISKQFNLPFSSMVIYLFRIYSVIGPYILEYKIHNTSIIKYKIIVFSNTRICFINEIELPARAAADDRQRANEGIY